MDQHRFLRELPSLFEGWGTFGAHPRSERFAELLQSIRGMTSPAVLQLLNHAVNCLEFGESYCEVGCFQGSTLIGALIGHSGVSAFAVDNFSEFDLQGQNQRVLLRNLETFHLLADVSFRNQDFESFLLDLRRTSTKIGVYLYDGAHDYRSQIVGLLLAVPLLAERALIVVDDANEAGVKQATLDFLASQPAASLLIDLPTPGNGHPSFWNGLQVLGWNRNADHHPDPVVLQRSRQQDLLASLYALQRFRIRIQGSEAMVTPT
jgi:protein O-GlcNAc transferase